MRVLFSNPPWFESDRIGVRAGSRWPFTFHGRSAPDRFRWGDYLPFPFFMGYAASYLKAAMPAVHVELRDSIALRESEGAYFAHLRDTLPEYVVIESATPSWDHDLRTIREINRINPLCKIVVTGPIAANARAILDTAPVQAVVKGEYEKGIVRVLNGESGVIEHDLLTLDEMNAAPFPMMPAGCEHRYYDPCPAGQQFPHAQVWSSRGCPFKCCFCIWPAAMTGNDPDGTRPRTVRHYSADYMEAFLTEWRDRYGFRSVYFDDDTFNLGAKHVERMCGVMERVKLPWSAMCRADTSKPETWKRMRESGCFGVKIGFESGSQYVVDQIVNKHLDLDRAAETVNYLANTLGMTVHGTFTIGLPGETKEQQQQTLSYIEALYRLGMTSHQLSGTAEIEGTPLATLRERGSLDAYPGATMDANYRRESDGNKKMQAMVRELQEA